MEWVYGQTLRDYVLNNMNYYTIYGRQLHLVDKMVREISYGSRGHIVRDILFFYIFVAQTLTLNNGICSTILYGSVLAPSILNIFSTILQNISSTILLLKPGMILPCSSTIFAIASIWCKHDLKHGSDQIRFHSCRTGLLFTDKEAAVIGSCIWAALHYYWRLPLHYETTTTRLKGPYGQHSKGTCWWAETWFQLISQKRYIVKSKLVWNTYSKSYMAFQFTL